MKEISTVVLENFTTNLLHRCGMEHESFREMTSCNVTTSVKKLLCLGFGLGGGRHQLSLKYLGKTIK